MLGICDHNVGKYRDPYGPSKEATSSQRKSSRKLSKFGEERCFWQFFFILRLKARPSTLQPAKLTMEPEQGSFIGYCRL